MIARSCLLSGLVVLILAWSSPLRELAQGAFWAHMTLHMIVVALAAPLLAIGLAGSRFDPVRTWPKAFPPVPLSVVELLVVWGWHTPALHQAARGSGPAFVAEQASFLVAGLLMWLSACGGTPSQRRERAGAGITALLLTSMHMTLLGALLALTPRPLYSLAGELCALPPLQDQHVGGALMLLVGGVVYLAGGLSLTVPLLRHRLQPAEVSP